MLPGALLGRDVKVLLISKTGCTERQLVDWEGSELDCLGLSPSFAFISCKFVVLRQDP